MRELEIPIWEKAAMSIEEASAFSSIGIVKLRELTSDPRCPFVLHIGNKRIIKKKEFIEFISKEVEI
ncbi:MAG: excisionase [Eubacterium sp.]|nr:excisionase [Eubacterium sp.]